MAAAGARAGSSSSLADGSTTSAGPAPAAAAGSLSGPRSGAAGAAGGVVARGLPTGPAIRAMQQQVGDRAAVPAAGGGPGAKLGRNDPCYCGSGIKYKKCHGR